MKFDLHSPEPDEASADAPASPEQSYPTVAEEPADGVKVRYGRAIDSALSSLAQLRAHTWHQPHQEPIGHDSHCFDSGDSAEAVFRPSLFSSRTAGER